MCLKLPYRFICTVCTKKIVSFIIKLEASLFLGLLPSCKTVLKFETTAGLTNIFFSPLPPPPPDEMKINFVLLYSKDMDLCRSASFALFPT
jgi:hypothetical protein